jgi:uncharacterized heparinase superfamily protein
MKSNSGGMGEMLRAVPVYWWSIVHLRPSMIVWRVVRTLKGAGVDLFAHVGLGGLFARIRRNTPATDIPPLTSRYHCEPVDLAARSFSFLRDEVRLPDDRSARRTAVAGQPLLWQFQYGYHDYLLALLDDDALTPERALDFALEWQGDHPTSLPRARRSAWHPYVLSIRIESWIRLHGRCSAAGMPQGDVRMASLRAGVDLMARTLRRNLEKGTMANHLMRNIKALLLAGLFLNGAAGRRALRTAQVLLPRELREQVLDDGCHFERAPMYHASVLSDVLDMVEALHGRGLPLSPELRISVESMTAFLRRALHPDGDVPYLNDSTCSFTLHASAVLARGEALAALIGAGIPAAAADPTGPRASGLLLHRDADLFVAFDAGAVGPDYQPGHAHCDTLSFELSFGGRRVITDTGVFHYRESRERTHSRSTAAHGTIQIENWEQSEVWKSFRVGRRARIIAAREEQRGGLRVFQAAHDGYARFEEGLAHERALAILPGRWVCVADWLHGAAVHRYTSRLHFHPDCVVKQAGRHEAVVQNGDLRHSVLLTGREAISLQGTQYYPAFGVKQSRSTLALTAEARFPLVTAMLIVLSGPPPTLRLDTEQRSVTLALPSGDVTLTSMLPG